jgi:hypothetical protein
VVITIIKKYNLKKEEEEKRWKEEMRESSQSQRML